MEMIDFVTSEFNYQDSRVRWTFFIVGIMDLLWWALCRVGNKFPFQMNIGQFICHILLLVITYIWVYFAPKFKERIEKLKKMFWGPCYAKLYDETVKMMYLYRKDLESKHVGFFLKLSYSALWFFADMYCIMVLSRFEIIPMNGSGLITMTLTLFSLILNFFSFYVGVEFVYFIRRVSNEADRLDYNESLPSSTKGFQELVYDSFWLSVFFFIISFLYTAALVVSLMFWYVDRSKTIGTILNPDIMEHKNNLIIIMVILICMQGLATTVLIAYSSSMFLNRILQEWKMKSLSKYRYMQNERMTDAIGGFDKAGAMLNMQGIMLGICKDRLRFRFGIYIVGVLSIAADVMTVIGGLTNAAWKESFLKVWNMIFP